MEGGLGALSLSTSLLNRTADLGIANANAVYNI